MYLKLTQRIIQKITLKQSVGISGTKCLQCGYKKKKILVQYLYLVSHYVNLRKFKTETDLLLNLYN